MSGNHIDHELRIAKKENDRSAERVAKLTATALGAGDMQTRMAAAFQLDAIEWKRRSRLQDRADDTLDRITIAKQNGEVRRNVRKRAERIAAGLVVRRPRTVTGAWRSTDQPDNARVRAGYRCCSVCGRTIADTRLRNSATCSPKCARRARAARAAKKASTVKKSLTIESATRRPEPVSAPCPDSPRRGITHG